MPSESPLWSNDWCSNYSVIGLGACIWKIFNKEIHFSDTSGCHHFNLYITSCFIIRNQPILRRSIIDENSEPLSVCASAHNKWMSAISALFSPIP